MSGFVPGRQNH